MTLLVTAGRAKNYPAHYHPAMPYVYPQSGNSRAVADFKSVVLFSILGLGAIGGGALLVRKYIRKNQMKNQQKHSIEEGNPATYATQFKMAFENDNYFGWGTNEELVYNTINAIASKKMYSKVQDSYQKLYNRSLNADLEDELSSDEYNKFIRILSSKKAK